MKFVSFFQTKQKDKLPLCQMILSVEPPGADHFSQNM